MSDHKSSTGLPPNLAAALSYVFGFISGLIFYVIEKDNRYIRFHAMQSILLSVTFIVLSILVGFIPGIRLLLYTVVQLAALICWIMGIIKAAQGDFFKFPLIGDWAEKQV